MEVVDDREFTFRKSDFRYIADIIHAQTGIVLADHKFEMMYARLARRLRQLEIGSVKDYIAYFKSFEGADELPNLINAMTTNLTRFFREAHHFETLRNDCLMPLKAELESDCRQRLRIWSAGCSSGMEAYTIAMTVAEALPRFRKHDILILATDIDTNMLDRARKGEYSKDDMVDAPAVMRKKYTSRASPERLRIKENLRSIIRFKKLNLLHEWPFSGGFEAIFCRNVLIYFDKETRDDLIARFESMLMPGGFLFLGHSEALAVEKTALESVGRSSFRKALQ